MGHTVPMSAKTIIIHHYILFSILFFGMVMFVLFFLLNKTLICTLYSLKLFELLPFFAKYSFVCNMKVVLSRELERCPTFSNLNTMSLGEWCMVADFDALIFLLQHSPNIERLFLQLKLVCVHTWCMLLDS
jgi:hypothetical protein